MKPLRFLATCHICQKVVSEIELDDDSDWNEAEKWSWLALAQHRREQHPERVRGTVRLAHR